MSYTRLDEENIKLEEDNKFHLKMLSIAYASHDIIYAAFLKALNDYLNQIREQITIESPNLPAPAKQYIEAYSYNLLLKFIRSMQPYEIIRDATRISETTKKSLIQQPEALKTYIDAAINIELDLKVSLPTKHDFSLFQKARKVAVNKERKPELDLLIDLRANFLGYKNKNKRDLVSKILDCINDLKYKIHNHLDASTLAQELNACIEETQSKEKKYYENLWFFSDYRKKRSSLNPLLSTATNLFNTYQQTSIR